MKKQLFSFSLYALTIYLTIGVLQSTGAVTHPLGENGTHICGVADVHPNKRLSDPFPNRHYWTAAAHLNAIDYRHYYRRKWR